MDILSILIPASLFLGAIGLVAFIWTMKSRQYDDPQGDANRILTKEWDDHPKPPDPPPS
jgi:cbb3-type cytochrome oxidase maturation protein